MASMVPVWGPGCKLFVYKLNHWLKCARRIAWLGVGRFMLGLHNLGFDQVDCSVDTIQMTIDHVVTQVVSWSRYV